MTRMAETNGPELGYDEEPPRSIFSALWFRALLVILVLGVIAAVAVPYVLDIVNPPVVRKTASAPPRQVTSPPAATESATAPPALPSPSAPSASAPSGVPGSTPAPTPPATSAASASKSAQPAKPVEPMKPLETAKPGSDTAKMATAVEPTKPAVAKAPAAPPATKKTQVATTSGGAYWVQVGAFKNQTTAKAMAARLRDQNYKVEESVKRIGSAADAPAAATGSGGDGTDRYNVFVSGSAPSDLTAKLTTKGLAADPVAGGVVIKPSLPLRDAVALSRDLTSDGLKVQVRRAGGDSAVATTGASAAAGATAGETFYRVRVAGFADRTTALTAAKELQGKGYQTFIGSGGR